MRFTLVLSVLAAVSVAYACKYANAEGVDPEVMRLLFPQGHGGHGAQKRAEL